MKVYVSRKAESVLRRSREIYMSDKGKIFVKSEACHYLTTTIDDLI